MLCNICRSATNTCSSGTKTDGAWEKFCRDVIEGQIMGEKKAYHMTTLLSKLETYGTTYDDSSVHGHS